MQECCGHIGYDGWPMRDKKTRQASSTFHATFDPIWKEFGVDREFAYLSLAMRMEMRANKVHAKTMNYEQLQKAIEVAKQMREELENDKT